MTIAVFFMNKGLESITRESVPVSVGGDFIGTLYQNTSASNADRIVELVANIKKERKDAGIA
jgi:hypothetical protein